MELPLREEYMDQLDYSFTVTAVNDTINAADGTRKLTLSVTHPGIIWTGSSRILRLHIQPGLTRFYSRCIRRTCLAVDSRQQPAR